MPPSPAPGRAGPARPKTTPLPPTSWPIRKSGRARCHAVDLGRNDLGRIAAPGTVRVEEVHGGGAVFPRHAHRVLRDREITGRLDALTFWPPPSRPAPCPVAPKVRAMQMIAELEKAAAATPYAGSIGWIGLDPRPCDLGHGHHHQKPVDSGTACCVAGLARASSTTRIRQGVEEESNKAGVLAEVLASKGGRGCFYLLILRLLHLQRGGQAAFQMLGKSPEVRKNDDPSDPRSGRVRRA